MQIYRTLIAFLCSAALALGGCSSDVHKSKTSPETQTCSADATGDATDTGGGSQERESSENSLVVLSEHPMACLNVTFDKFISVFGLYVVATQAAPLNYVMHTANVLAQYIDNDEDGQPDDSAVLQHLVENNYVVPIWSGADRDAFWSTASGTECEDNISMAASMYYDEDEWALGGIVQAGTWDVNLEEVWHVVTRGWSAAHPGHFGVDLSDAGEVVESSLTRAMDAARGGQFITVPESYPANAWYAYYDETCEYHCQIAEYLYWALMANMNALDPSLTNKCEDSSHEWHLCNQEELQETDILVYDLLNNQGFMLPTNIPDGSYLFSPSG